MEKESLVELEEGQIAVTPRGRLLVRAVCVVFDRYCAPSAGALSTRG